MSSGRRVQAHGQAANQASITTKLQATLLADMRVKWDMLRVGYGTLDGMLSTTIRTKEIWQQSLGKEFTTDRTQDRAMQSLSHKLPVCPLVPRISAAPAVFHVSRAALLHEPTLMCPQLLACKAHDGHLFMSFLCIWAVIQSLHGQALHRVMLHL